MTQNRTPRNLAIFLLLTTVNSFPLLAQRGTSSAFTGTIADKSGAMIADAQVNATEVNTGALRAVESNANGRFLLSQVNPGTSRLEVHAEGFGPGRSELRVGPEQFMASMRLPL